MSRGQQCVNNAPWPSQRRFFPRSKLPLNHNLGQDASFYQCTMRHLWDFGVESSSVARIFWRFAQSLSVGDGYWKNLLNSTKIQYRGLEKVTSQTAKLGMASFGLSISVAEHPLHLNWPALWWYNISMWRSFDSLTSSQHQRKVFFPTPSGIHWWCWNRRLAIFASKALTLSLVLNF